MPRRRDPRHADISVFSAKLKEAAALKGVSVQTLCQYLFKDSRLPGRVDRQHQLLALRRARLEAFIATFPKKITEGGGPDA